jgi:recombination protein RecR
MNYPSSIQDLINEFSRFPGIGPKTAQRFVFYLLRKQSQDIDKIVDYLKKIKDFKTCSSCNNFSETDICPICQDKKRDQTVITIIAEPQDLMAIEKIGEYNGIYFILGGLINTSQDITPDKIKIKQLIERLRAEPIKEIIFALSSTLEGESTTLYLVNLIKKDFNLNKKIKLTKVARGLPLGGEIEYADEITLSEALKERKII